MRPTDTPDSAPTGGDARERAWAVVEQCVSGGPVALGVVVGHLEAELGESPAIRSVSAFLQDMVRGGRIRLVNDGCRWTVCAAVQGNCLLCKNGALRKLGQWIVRARD